MRRCADFATQRFLIAMPITPLTLGAAATAAASIAQVIPSPNDFLSAFHRATGGNASQATATVKPAAPPAVTPESRQNARDTLQQIERDLSRLLSRNGLDASQPLELRAGEGGRIKVTCGGADAKPGTPAKQIEDLIASDSEITKLIQRGLQTGGLADMTTGGGTNFSGPAPLSTGPVKSLCLQSGKIGIAV
jgi:hypothetical protein